MYLSQCVKRAAQVSGNQPASKFGSRTATWNQFKSRIQCLAGGMQQLGLSLGDRAAVLSLNSNRYLELFFAIPWAGAVVVPINIRLAAPEILFTLNDSETELLVVDDAFAQMLPALEGKMNTVKNIIFAGEGETPKGCINYEELIAKSKPVEDAERGGDDIAGLFYTGGTTGRSKGVMLTHDNLVSNALNVTPFMKFDETSVYLHVAPMFHLADCASTFALTMAAGTHTFLPKFDPQETLQIIQDKDVSVCLLVPTMVNMLVNFPDIGNYDMSSLKTILYGASPMPEAVLLRAMELFPNCEFKQGYGMTETSPVMTFLDSKYHVTEGPNSGKLKSAGCAAYGVEILVVDENDKELPRGEVGEVIARGPNVMQGYWKMPEVTAETLRNGWMHTGDMAYMDDEGFIYIVDRNKDMIISGGENVYSTETEQAVYQHSAVQECAVIGIPHKEWGELVHAVVVFKPGQTATEDELKAHCASLIAGFKCPRSWEFRAEPLPMSGAGKILKTELRAPYWGGKNKGVN